MRLLETIGTIGSEPTGKRILLPLTTLTFNFFQRSIAIICASKRMVTCFESRFFQIWRSLIGLIQCYRHDVVAGSDALFAGGS